MAKLLLLLTILVLGEAALAQQPVKCLDKNGRTVYVDRDCQVYGLRSVGTVQDRVTVAPGKAGNTEGEGDSTASPQRGMQACRADAQKFCRGVKPGGGAMVDCLAEHQDDLSDDCYQLLKTKLKGAQ